MNQLQSLLQLQEAIMASLNASDIAESASGLSFRKRTHTEAFNATVTPIPKEEEALEAKKQLESLHDALMEAYECPICLDMVRNTPIFCCSNGHISCQVCKIMTDSVCSLCKEKLNARNLSLERLLPTVLAQIRLSCPNKINGCDQRLKNENLLEHTHECPFRIIRCPANHYNLCQWSGPLKDLLIHIKDMKCVTLSYCKIKSRFPFCTQVLIANGKWTFERGECSKWKQILFNCKTVEAFQPCLSVIKRLEKIHIYVRSFASFESIKGILYEIRIKHPENDRNEELRFLCPLIHWSHSMDAVLESGKALMIDLAQTTIFRSGNILFSVEVNFFKQVEKNGLQERVRIHKLHDRMNFCENDLS